MKVDTWGYERHREKTDSDRQTQGGTVADRSRDTGRDRQEQQTQGETGVERHRDCVRQEQRDIGRDKQ